MQEQFNVQIPDDGKTSETSQKLSSGAWEILANTLQDSQRASQAQNGTKQDQEQRTTDSTVAPIDLESKDPGWPLAELRIFKYRQVLSDLEVNFDKLDIDENHYLSEHELRVSGQTFADYGLRDFPRLLPMVTDHDFKIVRKNQTMWQQFFSDYEVKKIPSDHLGISKSDLLIAGAALTVGSSSPETVTNKDWREFVRHVANDGSLDSVKRVHPWYYRTIR